MSTQFDIAASSTSTAAVAGSSTGASCGANATAAAAAAAATAAGWPSEHLHHHQPHIAVHTPVHALRGSSSESQPSFSAYSSGSPQAGFHVPANAYSAITSPSCASASPYARKARYSDSDANGATDITVKLENGSSARLLDAFGASAPISMSHLNAIDCLPYYESKQQQHDQQKQQNKEESVPLPCISESSRSMDTVEDKFHSIFDYDNIDGNAELDATRQQQQVENGDPKSVNNNNNSNFVVDNNSSANNNNSDNNSNGNGSGQFYSLGKSGNRTFFRAPGLEAPDLAAMASAGGGIHVCPVCSFSCKSTFHYNSHMNTHGDHQCTMCNYTSRTEGRLRKHMRESHTHAERVKAGLEDGASENSASPGATATTIASLVNMVNMSTASAVVPLPASATANSATHDLLALSDMKSNFTATYADPFSLASDSLATKVIPGALDQIKALTERANNSMTALNEILGISSAGSHNDNNMHHDGVGPRDPTDDDDEMEAESSQAGPSLGQPTNGAAAVASQPPARRSGRPKIYRCKQCPHISTTKEQSWAHNRTHIPSDKQLNCKQCGFVTEYKHHLEYHMRNHKGSKPFKCTKCSYTCVNKSMLNSHMKSHTPVYQYRCKDCAYQTKYCHSLKMHLEKYRHTRMPGTVEIDSDGEEKPISEGDPDDYGHMDINESRNGEDSRHTDSVMADDQQQQQQQSSRQQQRQQQSLNSMLLQPIAPSAANLQQYSDQIQQYSSLRQLEQMNELLRAANPTNTFACQQCDYVTASNEELLRHNVAHLLVNQQQQHQQQQQTPSLTSLYHNLAAVQQQHQQQQQSDQQQQKLFSQQQQQALSNALGSSGSELLNGILQPDSGTKELAAQLQQELLRAQVVAQQQQQQQQQQEEESRRQAVVAAMASLANGNLGNGALTSALLGHVTSVTSSTGGVTSTDAHGAIFAPAGLADAMAADSGVVDPSIASSATVANHFHSSNTTTASGFGNDDDELQLAHSLSPMCSSGRRGSVGSASTSGGECTSKTCSVSPGSEGHGGSRKRKPSKTLKVEQISEKLRDGADEPKGHRSREHDAGESRRQNRMPHACQHCMIAFRDKALYQIHLGYHGYDTPFKCNRCGHVSDSPLEFNLHLYQAKHD